MTTGPRGGISFDIGSPLLIYVSKGEAAFARITSERRKLHRGRARGPRYGQATSRYIASGTFVTGTTLRRGHELPTSLTSPTRNFAKTPDRPCRAPVT